MTEEEWLTAIDPVQMMVPLRIKPSFRKWQWACTATCRTIWEHVTNPIHRNAIELSERHADRFVTIKELGQAISAVHKTRGKRNNVDWAVYETVRYPSSPESVCRRVADFVAKQAAPNPCSTWQSYFSGDELISEAVPPNSDRILFDQVRDAQLAKFSNFLRDIFGNPFRPVTLDPAWLTPTVVALAQSIYADRAFDRMPILADALEEAGCDNPDILLHCRGDGPHVKGCWVVDLVLGKE